MNLSLIALVLSLPLAAGSLEGSVRILEKNGSVRHSLEDAVAILEPVGQDLPKPRPSGPVIIRTIGKQFTPRVSLAAPGTEIFFPNQDHILHNVFSVSPGNRFDTGHYLPGETPKVKVANPGLIRLYCNVHYRMNAFIWVVSSPFAQLLAGRQGVAFAQVPPGEYRLRLWHPETGERVFPMKIGDEVTRGDWTLEVSVGLVEQHKNKFGRDYPPSTDGGDY